MRFLYLIFDNLSTNGQEDTFELWDTNPYQVSKNEHDHRALESEIRMLMFNDASTWS